jgi:hypothetical protein
MLFWGKNIKSGKRKGEKIMKKKIERKVRGN